MEKLRNKKILTMIVLVVAVVGLSVGFAAFSSVLTIQSQASISPDASTFKVVFSNKSNSIDTSEVKPTVNPTTISASNGVIENTSNPTLTGLKANFTTPGQKVVYNLYVYNAGEYVAYLNSITLKGNKSCTPGIGADSTLVNNACEDIKLTVKVGNDSYDKTTTGITGKSIAAGSSTPIEITIEYISGGSRADGPFSVSFNDVSLYYSSASGIDEEYEVATG